MNQVNENAEAETHSAARCFEVLPTPPPAPPVRTPTILNQSLEGTERKVRLVAGLGVGRGLHHDIERPLLGHRANVSSWKQTK